MNFSLYSPAEICKLVGNRARQLRLATGQRQTDLAAAAGVTLSTLKRFERSGAVGFETVVRIALALGAERELAGLFPPREARSLDDILAANQPRVRQKLAYDTWVGVEESVQEVARALVSFAYEPPYRPGNDGDRG